MVGPVTNIVGLQPTLATNQKNDPDRKRPLERSNFQEGSLGRWAVRLLPKLVNVDPRSSGISYNPKRAHSWNSPFQTQNPCGVGTLDTPPQKKKCICEPPNVRMFMYTPHPPHVQSRTPNSEQPHYIVITHIPSAMQPPEGHRTRLGIMSRRCTSVGT